MPQDDAIQVVLFVGLAGLYERLNFGSPDRLRAMQESALDPALRAIPRDGPAVVIVDATTNTENMVDFASLVRTSYPDFRGLIITIDPRDPTADLSINEWDASHSAFYERAAPPRFLKDEVRSALSPDEASQAPDHELSDEEYDELLELGRNEFVKRGERMLNIQTEVRAGVAMTIVTQIFDGGAIIHNSVQDVPRDEADLKKRVGRIAGMQHYEAVANVRRGRFD